MRLIYLVESGTETSGHDKALRPLSEALGEWLGVKMEYQTWQVDNWDETWLTYQSEFWREDKIFITDNSSIFRTELGWTNLTDYVFAYYDLNNPKDAYHITHELNHLYAYRNELDISIWYHKVHDLQRRLEKVFVNDFIMMPRVF